MSWKKGHICIWISGESSKVVLIKVLLGFKSARLNEITKEISVTRKNKRHNAEPPDTPPLK